MFFHESKKLLCVRHLALVLLNFRNVIIFFLSTLLTSKNIYEGDTAQNIYKSVKINCKNDFKAIRIKIIVK